MNTAKCAQNPWPFAKLLLLALCCTLACAVIDGAPSLRNTRAAFTETIDLGVLALFLLRISIAKVRKESGLGWLLYVAVLLLIPIAAEVYARQYIPPELVLLPNAK